jgi:hypothetical protein
VFPDIIDSEFIDDSGSSISETRKEMEKMLVIPI